MTDRIRALFSRDAQYSVVLKNAASLYLLQALNILAPLLALPYLTRTLGLEGFGIVAYAMSLVQIVTFLMEFSFNLVGTRRVSVSVGSSPFELSQVYSAVMVIKAALGTVAMAALALIVAASPSLRAHWATYLALLPMVAGEFLLPVWLFQGMQRMQYLPAISAVSRTLGLVAMVALVRTSDDLPFAALVQALPYLVSGALAQFIVHRRLGIRFHPILPAAFYRALFVEAAHVFGARLAGQVYTRGALVLLGAFASAADVGRFSIAQRVSGLLVATVVTPLSQSIYPYLCRSWEQNKTLVWLWRRRILFAAAGGAGIALLVVNASSDSLAVLLTGDSDAELQALLLLFSPAIALTIMNTLLATIAMAMNRYAQIARVVLIGGAVFLLLGFPMVASHGGSGMAITLFLVEGAVFAGCIAITRRRRRADPPDAPGQAR